MLTYSVVLATFPGREKYLEESVGSLRAQGVEPIIVGDTRWGPDKWNEALDNCQTDLLFLPHDDDVYDPTYIETMVKFMEDHPTAAAAFCLDRFIDADGRRTAGGTPFPPNLKEQDTYDFETVLNAMINVGNFLRCETVVLRTALIGDMRYPLDAGCGKAVDTAFWYLILNSHPIGIVNKTLVSYRQHSGQDTQDQRLGVMDHWNAIKYAVAMRPEVVSWDNHITLHQVYFHNSNNKEALRVQAKAKIETNVRLVVVHEPPDAAGTGVVAAARVRKANEGEGEIAYYVFPQDKSGAIQEGWFRGCPVIGCPPTLFPMVVKRFKPAVIEYHHTLFWGDGILNVETDAHKELYLHDRWMWSEHPHQEGKYRDTRKHLGGVKVFGNSEWTCKEAKEKLGVDVELFDAFTPLPSPAVSFRKRIGFFGGWSTTKGIHILLQAARKLPDVLFVLFTQPPEGTPLEGRQLYGHPNVLVMGAYTRSDMHLLVHLVDAVVAPSLFESFGLVKREIESLGVKVIATKTGGMDGDVPPDDVQALVEAIG